jgi:UDP-N-acetylmuramoyl-tripeptide--D-alanyl-D-alanine ligase
MELRLDAIAQRISGEILQGEPSRSFKNYTIDSRSSKPGELFFAIVARRDGHDFVPDALAKGAAGAVISRPLTLADPKFSLLLVEETQEALQALAHKVHQNLQTRIVGVTGSIGKTTTKEFLYSLLSTSFPTFKSSGNFNNHLGLPLSLLHLTPQHKWAVLEYGMSHAGEITTLTRIAAPDIAVLTNIKPVHLEFFSSLSEIALAKKEILMGMKPDGVAVLNGDDPLVMEISRDYKGTKILFGLGENYTICARNLQMKGWEGLTFDLAYGDKNGQIKLPFFNQAYLNNFLAAAGAAWVCGIPLENIQTQAPKLRAFRNRGQVHSLIRNIRLIDDSYNSNPAALSLALESMAALPGERKVVVLGDMLELGEDEKDFHQQAGKEVMELGLGLLLTVGSLGRQIAAGAKISGMKTDRILCFSNSEETAGEIWSLLEEGDVVLVKGSRGVGMDRIVTELLERG